MIQLLVEILDPNLFGFLTTDHMRSLALAPSPPLFATSSEGGSPMHHSLSRRLAPPTLAPSLPASDVLLFPTDRPLLTHETTFTYFTTRYVANTSTISTRKETITNYEIDSVVRPTQPLILTRTVLKTASRTRRPFSVVTTRPEIGGGSELHELNHGADEIVHESPDLPLVESHDLADPQPPYVHRTRTPLAHHPIIPTPVTYYTTFTYFTTELEHGHPVVRSREQVISTVVRGKVLPTRVRSPPRPHRSKRDAIVAGDVTKNSDLIAQRWSADRPLIQATSILDPIPTTVHGKHFFFEQENTRVIEYHLHERCNDS